jgi:hypothetical protein
MSNTLLPLSEMTALILEWTNINTDLRLRRWKQEVAIDLELHRDLELAGADLQWLAGHAQRMLFTATVWS